MNAEVIKAMNKKETKISKARKWLSKNRHKVMRVVLFPIWWGVCAKNKIEAYLNSKLEWSEERANEILSYYIPRKAKWHEDEKCFYFADNGMGWGMKCHQRKLKWKDRRWWRKFSSVWGGKIRTYLIEEFEMEGFKKEVGDTYDQWAEVTFYLIEK